MTAGTLYIVATPIGNLADISQRAVETLGAVDFIAAEDTRRCQKLLNHIGISAKVITYHDHNDSGRADELLDQLTAGRSMALVSDAGTPLIADPGYRLVRGAHQRGIQVVPVPGACAAIAALCAAGQPSDRFIFEGFLAAKAVARRNRLAELAHEPRTLVFYEAPHRVAETLDDMIHAFGGDRPAALARELSKLYETIASSTLAELKGLVEGDSNQSRGEIVLVVAGSTNVQTESQLARAVEVAQILRDKLSVKDAAAMASKICDAPRNAIYRALIER